MLWSRGICREPSVADRLQNVCALTTVGRFDDAQAEVRAAPALSGRLEAGSTSNLWFHGSQGMRVEIELPQGPDLSAISDIAMFYCGLSETVLRLPLVRTHGRNPRVRLPQAPSPLCIHGRARSDTRARGQAVAICDMANRYPDQAAVGDPWSGSLRFARDDARPPPPRGLSRGSIRSRKKLRGARGSDDKAESPGNGAAMP